MTIIFLNTEKLSGFTIDISNNDSVIMFLILILENVLAADYHCQVNGSAAGGQYFITV